ncbi:MAG: FGGY-family carbohydrate kinase [Anaerolineales bacterium]|jgi:xylulokinase
MVSPVLIGIDLGTSNCKVTAFTLDGRLVVTAVDPIATATLDSHRSEQEVEDWWQAVVRGLMHLWRHGAIDSHAVVGVGVCGHWPSLALLDAGGKALRPAIIWHDTRGIFSAPLTAEVLAARANLPIEYARTLPVSKLLWLKTNESRSLGDHHIGWCLGAKDTITFRLTGRAATDPLEARWTGMAGPLGAAWDEDVLQTIGLPVACLPEIRPMTACAGGVSAEAAAITGLAPDTPVAVGTGDGYCGAIGAGLTAPGQALVMLGSSLIVVTMAPRGLIPHDHPAIMCFPPLIDTYDVLYTSTPCGSADRFVTALIGKQELDRVRDQALALAVTAVAALFIPHVVGITSPWIDLDMHGAWLDLAPDQGWPELYRAVVEGIMFSARQILETIAGFGVPLRSVRLAGAGVTNPAMCQMYADALGLPLAYGQGVETGCLGAAALAAVAAGVYPDLGRAVEAMVPDTSEVFVPNPEKSRVYIARYQRFKEAMAWLRHRGAESDGG